MAGQHGAVLPSAGAAEIADRLAGLEGLTLPGHMTRGGSVPTLDQRMLYLTSLLQHDAGVFLERHGQLLTADERLHFEGLRGSSYEVNFWLQHLEDTCQPAVLQAAPGGTLSAVAKNRRLAELNRLEAGGQYFADEAMRGRQPALHHLYVGQYRASVPPQGQGGQGGVSTEAPTASVAAGAGGAATTLASILMAQQEELEVQTRRTVEEEQWGLVESEEESEEAGAAGKEEEEEESASAFLDIMKQRFLTGLDADFLDYAAIDANAALDEDLAVEAARDLEERYFDGD